MSELIIFRTKRFNQLGRTSLGFAFMRRPRFGKWQKRHRLRMRLKLGFKRPRYGSKKPFLGKEQPLFNMSLRRHSEQLKARHARCASRDHDWSDDNCGDESYCTACGMSFLGHVFMECP